MKRKNPGEKLAAKRAVLVARTAQILGIDQPAAMTLLSTERRQSVRLNPLQDSPQATLAELQTAGITGAPYTWMPLGYHLAAPIEVVRDHPLVHAGRAFIQNAASWLPVLALDPQPGERVLDACAAPGGKASHIAAATDNQAVIWANDNSRARLAKLQATMQRLGARAEHYTLFDATNLVRKLEGELFDKILLDAPCSGEGLMHLHQDKHLSTWSVAHIKRLAQQQRRIISQAWHLLRPGGTLVYSTCTMAPEENEAVVDYLLRSRPDAHLVPFAMDLPNRVAPLAGWNGKSYDPEVAGCLRLAPSQDIEAFFVCRLQKIA